MLCIVTTVIKVVNNFFFFFLKIIFIALKCIFPFYYDNTKRKFAFIYVIILFIIHISAVCKLCTAVHVIDV